MPGGAAHATAPLAASPAAPPAAPPRRIRFESGTKIEPDPPREARRRRPTAAVTTTSAGIMFSHCATFAV
ncbi:hypothetical protein EZE58_08950 [Brevibacterium sp. LS14]|nr:hypothetical protein [Brevibacterium sp. LS14]